jgi:hypothetical protein
MTGRVVMTENKTRAVEASVEDYSAAIGTKPGARVVKCWLGLMAG